MAATAPVFLAAGAGVSALGAISEGKAKSRAYGIQADIDERNAGIALDQGEADVVTLRKNIYRTVGAQRAANAASGLAASDVLDVIAETNTEGELDVQRRRREATLEAEGLRTQANLNRFYGKQARRAGYVGAASTSLLAAGKIATT